MIIKRQASGSGPRVRRFRQGVTIVCSALLLAACGEEIKEPQLPPEAVAVPALVQQMMDARFPADGEIHVQSRGKITITPDTPVCTMWKAAPELARAGHYFGVEGKDLARSLGKGRHSFGSGRGQLSATDPACREPGSVIIYGRKTDNRNGEPYKLALAVWQDDPAKEGAVWVGGVERLKGEYPVTELNEDGEFHLTIESVSISHDIRLINTKFIATFE